MIAVERGHPEIVRFLLDLDELRNDAGFCKLVNIANNAGVTPLQLADILLDVRKKQFKQADLVDEQVNLVKQVNDKYYYQNNIIEMQNIVMMLLRENLR